MPLLLLRVLEELLLDGLRLHSVRHVEVPPVAKCADQLGCQRFVEKAQYRFAIRRVARCDGPLLHVLTGAPAQRLYVAQARRLTLVFMLHVMSFVGTMPVIWCGQIVADLELANKPA